MKVIGYTRISMDKQDSEKQNHLSLQYAQTHQLLIDEFIDVEMSSRQSTKVRRIDELFVKLQEGDTLIVAMLSARRVSRSSLSGNLNSLRLDRIPSYYWPSTAILPKPSGSIFH